MIRKSGIYTKLRKSPYISSSLCGFTIERETIILKIIKTIQGSRNLPLYKFYKEEEFENE